MTGAAASVLLDPSAFAYVVGVDIGSEPCCFSVLTPQKQVVIKPSDLANAASGFNRLQEQLAGLGEKPARIVVGMEATSRNAGKALSLPPCLEAITCVCCTPDKPMSSLSDGGNGPRPIVWMPAPLLGWYRAGEARVGYVPDEQIASYRALVRLHTQLSDELARDNNEIQGLLVVLFPEFTQVFADPCRLTATAVLQAYPSARAIRAVGVDAIAAILRATAPRNYGRGTARRLVELAEHSVRSDLAVEARSLSLKIWCEHLHHTQAHLEHIDEQIERLLSHEPKARGLQAVPEFGTRDPWPSCSPSWER